MPDHRVKAGTFWSGSLLTLTRIHQYVHTSSLLTVQLKKNCLRLEFSYDLCHVTPATEIGLDHIVGVTEFPKKVYKIIHKIIR